MMFNFEGKTGAIGRLPWFIENRFPMALVRFDVEKEQPVRNAEGFCIDCAPDEVGEAIGKIVNDPEKPSGRFEGYARKEESEQKILRDVFERGDAWFRTGDLMRKDADGYFYFVDRIGDTFRWKGENVSTTEVAEAINTFDGITDANVYGVHVPGYDGRAGMAAIVCEHDCNLHALYAHLQQQLPDYARPAVPAHPQEPRRHHDLQAEEDRTREAGFRPLADARPAVFQRSRQARLRSA